MSFTFYMDLDTSHLEKTLDRLILNLGPVGLSLFLTGAVLPWVKQRGAERFTSEGDDVSGKWAPLEQSTQEFRAHGPWGVGPSHPINRRSGDLESYVTKSSSSVLSGGGASILVYPDVEPTGVLKIKADTAQAGKVKPKTVARPVIGLNERDLIYTMQALQFYVETGNVK